MEGRKRISILLAILLLLPVWAYSTNITFTSSGTITDGNTYDNVYVQNNGTVVNMSGGQINKLYTHDSSVFNMSGGQITGSYPEVDIYALSNFHMTGGLANLFGLYLFGNWNGIGGRGVLNEGILSAQHVKIYNNAELVLSGGNITFGTFNVMDDGLVNISEGNILIDNAFINYGGDHPATINIYGHGFNYTPMPGDLEGILTGYLLDNNFFTINGVSQSEYARFNLIPEPVSLLLFGFGLLVLRKTK